MQSRHVSRFSLRGGGTAKRGPEIRGARGQEPQGTPYQKPKVCRFGPLFFSRDPFSFLFSYFYYLILSYFTAQEGATAIVPPPPPPWIRPWCKAHVNVVCVVRVSCETSFTHHLRRRIGWLHSFYYMTSVKLTSRQNSQILTWIFLEIRAYLDQFCLRISENVIYL